MNDNFGQGRRKTEAAVDFSFFNVLKWVTKTDEGSRSQEACLGNDVSGN